MARAALQLMYRSALVFLADARLRWPGTKTLPSCGSLERARSNYKNKRSVALSSRLSEPLASLRWPINSPDGR